MKRQIRKGVFETNSSSMHALCISKERKYDLPDSIEFTLGSFGWGPEELNSTHERASYLYTAITYIYRDNDAEKYTEYINELEYILVTHGVKVKFNDYHKYSYYIDHAWDLCDWLQELFNDEEKLLTFLFGDAFILVGSDNGDWYEEQVYGNWDAWDRNEMLPKFDSYDVYEKTN